MADEALVIVSCPANDAQSLARTLIEEQLAACVSVLPGVKSFYTWKKELCEEEETLLFIKTSKRKFSALESRICQIHSYEIPEIICLSIEKGYAPYLDWLNQSLISSTK